MASRTARLFVALELDRECRRRLAELAVTIRGAEPSLRVVPPDGLHLTLQFLGSVERSRIDAIAAGLRAAVTGAGPARLDVVGLGAFPSLRAARVVWAGVEDQGATARLAARVERALVELGFDTEPRPFVPHVTLGRIRGGASSPRLEGLLVSKGRESFGRFVVDEVVLVESELRPAGARYLVRARAPLT